MSYYTGVGSRETPQEVLGQMYHFAKNMANHGQILRTGGANGADDAFAKGAQDSRNPLVEIYLPWQGFNNWCSPFNHVSDDALMIAKEVHPAWHRLSLAAKKLHGRNVYQVLGDKLDKPSALLVCWTKNGELIGGTRTAIVLAHMYNIPVFNLGKISMVETIKFVKTHILGE